MDERYGKDNSQRIQDTQWIEEATLANEAKIVETAIRVSGPYVISVNLASGLRRTKLAFPPS
jgi:hypothetical protein